MSFDESIRIIAWWGPRWRLDRMGRDDCRRSLIRVLDIGGMLLERAERNMIPWYCNGRSRGIHSSMTQREWLRRIHISLRLYPGPAASPSRN